MTGIMQMIMGGGARKLEQIVLTTNTNNYVLNTAKVTGYQPGNTDVELTISAGVTVGSAATGFFAFDIDTSWASGDTVKIINNGTIAGKGGNGGNGGASYADTSANFCGSSSCAWGGSGAAGGPAVRAQRSVSITNNGIIAGGGGGGGGGGGWLGIYSGSGGGGGGQSSTGSTGGSGGTGSDWSSSGDVCTPMYKTGGNGNPGSLGAAGTGGTANGGYYNGAAGGAWGSAGNTASGNTCSGGSGGAGGACTSGNANITWLATGTRYGALN